MSSYCSPPFRLREAREAVSSHEDQDIKMCAVKYSLKISIGYLTEGAHFYDTLEKLETASIEQPPRSPGRRVLATVQGATQCDVQEHLLLPSRQSCKRSAECHPATFRSSTPPASSRSKWRMSWSTPADSNGRTRHKRQDGYPVRSTTIHAPGQKRVKGNELGGGIPQLRPPDDWEKVVDHQSREDRTVVVGRLSGAKRQASSDSDARQPPAQR
jgi:hypothetical protein